MAFKKMKGEDLVKMVKEEKFRELKNEIEEEIVDKIANRISSKKEKILKEIRDKRLGKK